VILGLFRLIIGVKVLRRGVVDWGGGMSAVRTGELFAGAGSGCQRAAAF